MAVVFSFRLLRIPVTVRASFLLVAALISLRWWADPLFFVAWVVIVFVSILIHELGHALTARGFGAGVEIELNGLGGLTRWSGPAEELGPGRRALVAAAGSAVGVFFGGLVWLFDSQFGPYFGLTGDVIDIFIFVNVFWGLLNWLPIRPLDGGHLLLSLLEKFAAKRGDAIARGVFIVTAGAALAAALRFGFILIVFLAGWLLLSELGAGRPRQPAVPIPPFSYDKPPAGENESPRVEHLEAEPEEPEH